MPLITIESKPPADPAALLTQVREAGARALDCSLENIWVRLTPAVAALGGPHPVVVIHAQTGRSRSTRGALASAVAGAVARGLGVSAEDVWLHYHELRPEDVWLEGRWTREEAP